MTPEEFSEYFRKGDNAQTTYPRVFKTPKSRDCSAFNIVPIHRWFDRLLSYTSVSVKCPCSTCIVRPRCRNTLYETGWVSEINTCGYFESYVFAVYQEFVQNRSNLLKSTNINEILPASGCILLRITGLKAYSIIIHRSYLGHHYLNVEEINSKSPGDLLMFYTLVFSATELKINPFNLNDRICGYFRDVIEIPTAKSKR